MFMRIMRWPFISLMLLAVSVLLSPEAKAEASSAGSVDYQKYCAECHNANLKGGGHGVALTGERFRTRWGKGGVPPLATFIRSMMSMNVPANAPPSVVNGIAAFLLRSNGIAVSELKPAASEQKSDQTNWQGAAGVMEAAQRAGGWVNREAPLTSPVTDALLRNPPAADWPQWRRTEDGQGFSPLSSINTNSVGRLRLAWAMTMKDGSNQPTPLIHEGVMYLTHPGNVVQAIEAASGSLLWEYAYPYPEDSRTLGGPTRNIALYQDKVFLATYDAAIVALEARTGKLLWRAVKADYRQGFTHTAGPFIAGGVVVSGINGCERYKKSGCFITGHDPSTGKELWRTSTIALPGDPNDASWAGQPVELRGGGDNWITGSYDPQLNLYYFGTAQAKPWVAASRGMTAADAALYTNATLALDPRTGKLQWHFQHVPGETLDMETGFERVLVDIGPDKFVLTAGKDGLLWKLDRSNGKFVAVTETLYQNIFKSIDHSTGRVEYRDDIMNAGVDDTVSVCPSIYGGHNWQASAYDPASNLLLLPLHQLCVDMTGRAVERKEGGGGYGGESTIHPMPGTDGMLGRLSAIDVTTLKPRWSHTQRAMFMTSALTTGGGLAFIGDLDRYFKAFDVNTGKVLWQTRLGSAPHGYPVTYAVGGKQYIAVTTGMGVFKLVTAQQSPDIYQPSGGNMLYVFELAD
jgi:alcohol dehydrogenase (cytochrome c)